MPAPLILNSGTLATVTTDAVGIAIAGSDYATARFTVLQAGTATATAQVSIDGGVNYIPAPYAKKVSAVSANPTVQAISATTLVTADAWEVPLPGNCTNFRLLCAASGTATQVSLTGGAPYVIGVPVAAVLYDVLSAVNTALDTGVLDFSGWTIVSVFYTTPAGGSGAIKQVDDAGTAVSILTVPASAGVLVMLAEAGPTSTTAVATSGAVSVGMRLKRAQLTSAQVAAVTSRIRIEAFR